MRRWRTENHNPSQLLFGVSSGVPFHPSEEKKKKGFEGERDIPENNCKEHKTAIILLSVSFMYVHHEARGPVVSLCRLLFSLYQKYQRQ